MHTLKLNQNYVKRYDQCWEKNVSLYGDYYLKF